MGADGFGDAVAENELRPEPPVHQQQTHSRRLLLLAAANQRCPGLRENLHEDTKAGNSYIAGP